MLKNFGFLDIAQFLQSCKTIFCEKVRETNQSVKAYVVLDATFSLSKPDRVIEENKTFLSPTLTVFRFSDLLNSYDENITNFLAKTIEEFQETDSGWTLKGINFLTVHIQQYNPMRAGTFMELPDFIEKKGRV